MSETAAAVTLTQKIGLTTFGGGMTISVAAVTSWVQLGGAIVGLIAGVWTVWNLWDDRKKRRTRREAQDSVMPDQGV
ncbi:MAG: hypothetical protein ACRCV9_16330 [Burkholderiaceae bacterium]